MHDSVLPKFRKFSEKFEGRFLWPYLDIAGAPTVGIGCLIDPLEVALQLPWRLVDGSVATREQIVTQWHTLKAEVRLAKIGAKFAQGATNLRLTEADVDALFERRMALHEAHFKKAFPFFESFPADAQCAIHSLAWAMGAGFSVEFPRFTRAANAHDWLAAQAECTIAGERTNKGLIPRNVANRICLGNAAAIRDDAQHAGRARGTHKYTFTELYWPRDLSKEVT